MPEQPIEARSGRFPLSWVAAAVVFVITIGIMVLLFRPPPRRVVIAAGPAGSPAWQLAER